jgi:hypothetical protein
MIASSPKRSRNRSVALSVSVSRPTSVSVDALGSSRVASASPISASATTTATVAIGWSVTVRATRPSRPATSGRHPNNLFSTRSAYGTAMRNRCGSRAAQQSVNGA